MSMQKTMRQLLSERKCVLAPEVYDCASTLAAERTGFESLVISGAELSMSLKGIPDIGLLNVEEVLFATERICACSKLPVIVDMENGYGPEIAAAHNCERAARMGAGGVILVDSPEVRIGDALPLKPAVNKMRAVADALKGTDCILVARTDVHTLEEAKERCIAYREAGADMTLVFMINEIKPADRFAACKEIAAVDKGWKWYPDLGCHNGKSDVTLDEIAEYGFNYVGIHYLLKSAMTAMLDAGAHNFKNQNNVYAIEHYTAEDIGTEEELDAWYEYEKKYVDDPNLRTRWPYGYHIRNRGFAE